MISHSRRPDYIGAMVAGETALQAVRFNLPAWYVGEELIEALVRTAPPPDFIPESMPWPLPSLTFFLPETPEVKRIFGGRQPLWITGCKVKGVISPTTGEKYEAILNHVVAELPTEGLTEYHSVLRVHEPLSQWGDYPFKIDEVTREAHEDFGPEAEKRFTQQMTYLFLSMVMLLSQERPAPGFIEDGEVVPSKGKADKPLPHTKDDIDRLWNPSWLGRNYRVKKPPIVVGHHGAHASPVCHWRRGTWRHQPYGPERSLRKTIWIEPVLVAAPKEDQP